MCKAARVDIAQDRRVDAVQADKEGRTGVVLFARVVIKSSGRRRVGYSGPADHYTFRSRNTTTRRPRRRTQPQPCEASPTSRHRNTQPWSCLILLLAFPCSALPLASVSLGSRRGHFLLVRVYLYYTYPGLMVWVPTSCRPIWTRHCYRNFRLRWLLGGGVGCAFHRAHCKAEARDHRSSGGHCRCDDGMMESMERETSIVGAFCKSYSSHVI
jgi:hypothetical protein